MKKDISIFDRLSSINVNNKTEKKKDLTYLSWSFAWAEVLKIYPNATYKILRYENNLPYLYDENTGYMVFTEVTIECKTLEMWLPVMDGANKAMKNKSYTYSTKYGDKTCEAATMFDINKTIMRCLVKNIGMFGLGIYIYSGEDLPEVPENIVFEIIESLKNCENVKQLEEIWNNNTTLQCNKQFKEAVKNFKALLSHEKSKK